MRILFKKGKQNELLKKEREKRGVTWSEFAKSLNIKPGKLRAFVYEESLIDEQTFNKLVFRGEYERFIIKKLDENWGRIKGGKNSIGSLKEIKIPEKNEDLAELWGIMLGDGNITRIKEYKVGTYNINVTGHSVLDKDYLLKFVIPLGERIFGVRARSYYFKNSNAMRIIFHGRKIVDFFEKEGYMAGDKIRNKSTIPSWINENPRFLVACLRGLLDTDGSFYKLTNQSSHQVCFTNKNPILLRDVRDAFISLGIGCSKITKEKDIVITRRSEIAKFYKLISFHNSKHLNKIKAWDASFSPVV